MKIAGYSVLLLCLIPTILFSQNHLWEGGVALGGINYTGDLAKTSIPHSKETHPWLSLYISRQLRPNLSLQGHIGTGEISGDDRNYEDRKLRSFYFTTQITELQFRLQWYPFIRPGLPKPRITPYGFAGLGVFHLSPNATLNRAKIPNLREAIAFDQENLPSKIQPALPFGGGLEWNLNQKMKIGLETSLRLTMTDYLDGVSQAGNPEGNDWYGTMALTFGYKFGESDLDKDGIVDYKDACPHLPGPIALDGCPDTDLDGIADVNDVCPMLSGSPAMGGCPDRDNDGITDRDDQCPDTPGLIQLRGCPASDVDNDGTPDNEDPCPLQPGPPERQGCPPIDSDEDGLLNEDDLCPNQYGLAIFQGCPDTDGDGIEDRKDKCPELFGLYSQEGCPLKISAVGQANILNRQTLLFTNGSSEIQRYSLLDDILGFLTTYPEYKILIKGYTDREGDTRNNLQLSTRRARACYDYFRSGKVEIERMQFKGYGSDYPISENSIERGRKQNRRVEFVLFK